MFNKENYQDSETALHYPKTAFSEKVKEIIFLLIEEAEKLVVVKLVMRVVVKVVVE